MRGPSSSHTAASWRIGAVGLAFLDDGLAEALVEFDEHGAWAPNYEEQGTLMGMNGGLLGIDITDERIIDTESLAEAQGVTITYAISRFPTDHANTVRLSMKGRSGKTLSLTAVSLGGGMFEIRILNGHRLRIQGDYHELLGFTQGCPSPEQKQALEAAVPENCSVHWSSRADDSHLFQLKASQPFPDALKAQLDAWAWVQDVATAPPILPIISGRDSPDPFTSVQKMLDYKADEGLSLGTLGVLYEQKRSGLSEQEVKGTMRDLVGLIEASIATGLAGTEYDDRILPQQSHLIKEAEAEGRIHADPMVNRMIENIAAIMESKSAMHVIVAAPTAGGCGALGGTIKAYADRRQSTAERKIQAYFAAGMIGVFFAEGPGFSAEEGGCQVECGAAAAMTAAALVDLSGGTATQAVNAASMALQNMIGLVCDPVADRVEVPCLGKNIAAGMNALAASVMALSGFNPVIPLDQVITTVEKVAATLPASLCCTGLGGLAATPTSHALKDLLAQKKRRCAAC